MTSNSVLRNTAFVLFVVFAVFAGTACSGSDNNTSTIECVHDWEWMLNAVEATCVEPSKDTAVCKNTPCDATDVREGATPIDPTAHTDFSGAITSAPTATTDGEEEGTCTACNNSQVTRTLYATGTAGLAFEAIGVTAYRVRAGSVDTGVVHIPRFHRPNASSPYRPVTEVATSAFRNQNNITGVIFLAPSNITTIGFSAFFGCTGLTSVVIPDSVTTIDTNAFSRCHGLTSFTVDAANPNFVIHSGVLYNKAMTRLIQAFPAGITGNFTIPDSVTTIGAWAFEGCIGLTSVVIPNSVTTIDGSAFAGCTGLTSITIPNSVTSIGMQAFWSCTGLTSITIPNSVTHIGAQAFVGCTGLTSIMVDVDNQHFVSQGGVLYNKAMTTLVHAPIAGITGSFTIPSGVTYIDVGAFSGCTGLTSITIPDSVTTIGDHAFINCTGLTSVTIPNSVTTIRSATFAGCWSLTSVTVLAEVPPTLFLSDAFNNTHASLQIFVPAGSVDAYKAAWGSQLPAPGADRIEAIP